MKKTTPHEEYIELLESQLKRLLRLRREYADEINPLGSRLLDKAIKTKGDDLFFALYPKEEK